MKFLDSNTVVWEQRYVEDFGKGFVLYRHYKFPVPSLPEDLDFHPFVLMKRTGDSSFYVPSFANNTLYNLVLSDPSSVELPETFSQLGGLLAGFHNEIYCTVSANNAPPSLLRLSSYLSDSFVCFSKYEYLRVLFKKVSSLFDSCFPVCLARIFHGCGVKRCLKSKESAS